MTSTPSTPEPQYHEFEIRRVGIKPNGRGEHLREALKPTEENPTCEVVWTVYGHYKKGDGSLGIVRLSDLKSKAAAAAFYEQHTGNKLERFKHDNHGIFNLKPKAP